MKPPGIVAPQPRPLVGEAQVGLAAYTNYTFDAAGQVIVILGATRTGGGTATTTQPVVSKSLIGIWGD